MTLPEFDEGDRIGLLGHEYVVDSIDPRPDDRDRVYQYRLERVDGDAPAASLQPKYEPGIFVASTYHEVDPDDVDVVDDGGDD